MSTDGDLRSILRQRLREFHWQSIEVGATGMGVPDANFCGCGVEGWIELKQTPSRSVTLRPHQVAWLERRARAGGHVLIGVRRRHDGGPRRGGAVDELWILDGGDASRCLSGGLQDGADYVLGCWSGGPSKWNWDSVRRILLRQEPQ